MQRWVDIINKQYVLFVQKNGIIAGFGTLDNNEYVDMFYINKVYQRQGIANKIYNELEAKAQSAGKAIIFSHVSKLPGRFS